MHGYVEMKKKGRTTSPTDNHQCKFKTTFSYFTMNLIGQIGKADKARRCLRAGVGGTLLRDNASSTATSMFKYVTYISVLLSRSISPSSRRHSLFSKCDALVQSINQSIALIDHALFIYCDVIQSRAEQCDSKESGRLWSWNSTKEEDFLIEINERFARIFSRQWSDWLVFRPMRTLVPVMHMSTKNGTTALSRATVRI